MATLFRRFFRGGFFERVPPPRAAASNSVDPDQVKGQALLGFRVCYGDLRLGLSRR
jgi:hypothetical protein